AETGWTENRNIALTNKIFSYLLAGIPAILSDIPAHLKFAKEAPGAAFLFETENAQSLANVLDRILGNAPSLGEARSKAYRLAQDRYNWENEQAKLLRIVGGLEYPRPQFQQRRGAEVG